MTTPRSRETSLRLAREMRERFVAATRALIAPMATAILGQLDNDAGLITTARAMQEHRDDFLVFRAVETDWVLRVQTLWHNQINANSGAESTGASSVSRLQLIDDEVVENNILASRLALAIHDAVSFEFSDLRLRVQDLEDRTELPGGDVLRPDTLARLLVEQWLGAELSRALWNKVQDTLRKQLLSGLFAAYREANAFLVQQGVSPQIDLKRLVRRTGLTPAPDATSPGVTSSSGVSSGHAAVSAAPQAATPPTPMMVAGQRARAVLTGLKRFVTEQLGGEVPGVVGPQSSGAGPSVENSAGAGTASGSAEFLTAIADAGHGYLRDAGNAKDDATASAVQRSASELRRRSNELKRQAPTTADKATVEIVALMFQSILAEERIPFSARVWFARLQMPVLRVAIADPEFFGTLEHPARMLIDRMGSCVMGFDVAVVTGSALEGEIRRVVQVIEQYPETGQRVFKLVYDEFVVFLARYLTKSEATQRVMSIAQQVEQKETMAIQYTIELRKMLNDMPVREEIREFLFKVWAEVLAIAALRYGGQDERTTALKKAASELVWAASAKPNRTDRTRVIQNLPRLLQGLRRGMTLLGVVGDPQEKHIKVIGDTLTDAFMSKTEAIPAAQIEAMALRLAHIEEFVGDAADGTLPLDIASIELLLGVDAASLEVVPDTGAQVAPGMIEWARALQVGTWFMLDHNIHVTQVQFVWRSERKQLYLFASGDGRSFLIQAGRLASYLQAGLLVPAEDEALTVRATREALAKLDANPERLLS